MSKLKKEFNLSACETVCASTCVTRTFLKWSYIPNPISAFAPPEEAMFEKRVNCIEFANFNNRLVSHQGIPIRTSNWNPISYVTIPLEAVSLAATVASAGTLTPVTVGSTAIVLGMLAIGGHKLNKVLLNDGKYYYTDPMNDYQYDKSTGRYSCQFYSSDLSDKYFAKKLRRLFGEVPHLNKREKERSLSFMTKLASSSEEITAGNFTVDSETKEISTLVIEDDKSGELKYHKIYLIPAGNGRLLVKVLTHNNEISAKTMQLSDRNSYQTTIEGVALVNEKNEIKIPWFSDQYLPLDGERASDLILNKLFNLKKLEQYGKDRTDVAQKVILEIPKREESMRDRIKQSWHQFITSKIPSTSVRKKYYDDHQ